MDASQIPDELLERALSDPQIVGMLEKLHEKTGDPTPFLDLPKDHQKAALAALSTGLKAQEQQQQGDAAEAAQDVPDDLVRQVFEDPRAQEMLAKVMSDNGLQGAPADLPFEVQKQIVGALVAAGAIRFGPGPDGSGTA